MQVDDLFLCAALKVFSHLTNFQPSMERNILLLSVDPQLFCILHPTSLLKWLIGDVAYHRV